jgi:hypothetical protein
LPLISSTFAAFFITPQTGGRQAEPLPGQWTNICSNRFFACSINGRGLGQALDSFHGGESLDHLLNSRVYIENQGREEGNLYPIDTVITHILTRLRGWPNRTKEPGVFSSYGSCGERCDWAKASRGDRLDGLWDSNHERKISSPRST